MLSIYIKQKDLKNIKHNDDLMITTNENEIKRHEPGAIRSH
ncbi:Protein of unknown function [Bacillus mycoides]|uniref:Uncharacterized protein n=1 Tax=Bacillus mycoides TaxID=1405 RepID=A0A1G4ETX1_BACMY|nr:Protein of unknown function [Bacillus mycoides]